MSNEFAYDLEEFKRLIRLMLLSIMQISIKLNWRKPITIGFRGEIYTEAGVINVDIAPSQTDEGIYETALHEAAHYLCEHVEQVPPKEYPIGVKELFLQHGPILQKSQADMEAYYESPQEFEARGVAQKLDEIIRNVARREFGDESLMARLRAATLIRYYR